MTNCILFHFLFNWYSSRLGTADLALYRARAHISKCWLQTLIVVDKSSERVFRLTRQNNVEVFIIVTNLIEGWSFKKQLCQLFYSCMLCIHFLKRDTNDRQIIQTLKRMGSVIWTACTHRHLSGARLSPPSFRCHFLPKSFLLKTCDVFLRPPYWWSSPNRHRLSFELASLLVVCCLSVCDDSVAFCLHTAHRLVF